MSMSEILRQAINSWTEEKPARSLSVLRRLSGVSYSTLRRIAQGNGSASAETALKVADVVMTEAEFKQFTCEFMPALARTRSEISYKPKNEETLELLYDRKLTGIILLASHKDGTNEVEVQEMFGHETALQFRSLVEEGKLARAGGGNWRIDENIGSVNLELARELLASMAGLCCSANDSLPRASLAHVGWESVNLETAVAIYHAALTFVRTASGLAADKANRGEILIFFGSLFNVMKGTEAYR